MAALWLDLFTASKAQIEVIAHLAVYTLPTDKSLAHITFIPTDQNYNGVKHPLCDAINKAKTYQVCAN